MIDGVNADGVVGGEDWRNASYKAAILRHPMYEQLLAAHVACLRVATPVDQIPRIDAQLSQLHTVAAKYSNLGVVMDNKELDHFMVGRNLSVLQIYFVYIFFIEFHRLHAKFECLELLTIQQLIYVYYFSGKFTFFVVVHCSCFLCLEIDMIFSPPFWLVKFEL